MSQRLQLIVGLGNPGPDYAGTRHNAGELFARAVVAAHGGEFRNESKFHGHTARIRVDSQDVWLLIPRTYMNRSGRSIAAFLQFYRIAPEAMLVAHDELDFEPGLCRIKQGGGHGGHNGLRDIISAIGSSEFNRLRIGIGHPGDSRDVSDYVLKNASKTDQQYIEAAVDEALRVLPEMLACQWPLAMNRLHSFDASGDD